MVAMDVEGVQSTGVPYICRINKREISSWEKVENLDDPSGYTEGSGLALVCAEGALCFIFAEEQEKVRHSRFFFLP